MTTAKKTANTVPPSTRPLEMRNAPNQNPAPYMEKMRKKMDPRAIPTPMPFLAPNFFASFSFTSYLCYIISFCNVRLSLSLFPHIPLSSHPPLLWHYPYSVPFFLLPITDAPSNFTDTEFTWKQTPPHHRRQRQS